MRKSGGSAPGGGKGIPFGSVGIGGPGAPEGLGGNGGNGIPRPRGARARMKNRLKMRLGKRGEMRNDSRGIKPAGGPFPAPPGMGKGSGGMPPMQRMESARRMIQAIARWGFFWNVHALLKDQGRFKEIYPESQTAVAETADRPWDRPLPLEAPASDWRPPVLRRRKRR